MKKCRKKDPEPFGKGKDPKPFKYPDEDRYSGDPHEGRGPILDGRGGNRRGPRPL